MNALNNSLLTKYKQLVALESTSTNLKNPTPANLRNEAFALYQLGRKGSSIINQFSNHGEEVLHIRQLDIDKFKPVKSYLIGKVESPNARVIEMVKFFIDYNEETCDEVRAVLGKENKGKLTSFFSKQKQSIAIATIGIIATFGFFNRGKAVNEQCMYWNGNEFKNVGCEIQLPYANVVALDQFKLDNLKRINRLDTIGEKDLGKVWYVKINKDSADFYTYSGHHPITNKTLLPMTKYILNKYILNVRL